MSADPGGDSCRMAKHGKARLGLAGLGKARLGKGGNPQQHENEESK